MAICAAGDANGRAAIGRGARLAQSFTEGCPPGHGGAHVRARRRTTPRGGTFPHRHWSPAHGAAAVARRPAAEGREGFLYHAHPTRGHKKATPAGAEQRVVDLYVAYGAPWGSLGHLQSVRVWLAAAGASSSQTACRPQTRNLSANAPPSTAPPQAPFALLLFAFPFTSAPNPTPPRGRHSHAPQRAGARGARRARRRAFVGLSARALHTPRRAPHAAFHAPIPTARHPQRPLGRACAWGGAVGGMERGAWLPRARGSPPRNLHQLFPSRRGVWRSARRPARLRRPTRPLTATSFPWGALGGEGGGVRGGRWAAGALEGRGRRRSRGRGAGRGPRTERTATAIVLVPGLLRCARGAGAQAGRSARADAE